MGVGHLSSQPRRTPGRPGGRHARYGVADVGPLRTDLRPIETLDHVTNVPSSVDLSNVTDLDVAGLHGATSSVVSVVSPDLGDDVVHGVHGTVTGRDRS
jgi:hypothetical protein